MKDLQQIKDQVASECGWDLWTSLYTAGNVTNGMIAQVAVRYAEEQNRELVEMLEIIYEGINTMDYYSIGETDSPWTGYGIIQQLLEWHFDVFGLIDRGMAVAIERGTNV